MQCVLNQEVTEAYEQRIVDFLMGRRPMPEVLLSRDRPGIHLSDLENCPAPAYFSKVLGAGAPDLSASNAVKFFRGRCVERAIGIEQPRIFVDDISMTIDDDHPELGIAEIKSTAESSEWFDPPSSQPAWIERTKGYCHGKSVVENKDILSINLVVYFLFGNVPSRLWWNIKKYGKAKEKYTSSCLKAWTLTYTEEELIENWEIKKKRRDMMNECLKAQVPPSEQWILSQRPDWMCNLCDWKGMCEVYHREHPEEEY